MKITNWRTVAWTAFLGLATVWGVIDALWVHTWFTYAYMGTWNSCTATFSDDNRRLTAHCREGEIDLKLRQRVEGASQLVITGSAQQAVSTEDFQPGDMAVMWTDASSLVVSCDAVGSCTVWSSDYRIMGVVLKGSLSVQHGYTRTQIVERIKQAAEALHHQDILSAMKEAKVNDDAERI